MCWDDKFKSRNLQSSSTVASAGGDASLQANPNRVSLALTSPPSAGSFAQLLQGGGSGPPLFILTETESNGLLKVEDYGQALTGPLFLDAGSATNPVTMTEIVIMESPP